MHLCACPLCTSLHRKFHARFCGPSLHSQAISPNPLQFLSSTPSPLSVPNYYSIPIAQRVRRASGFLLVSLSKMPRGHVPDSRRIFCPRHFRSSLATIRDSANPQNIHCFLPARPLGRMSIAYAQSAGSPLHARLCRPSRHGFFIHATFCAL